MRLRWPGEKTQDRTNWVSNMLQGVAAVIAIVTGLATLIASLMWLLSQCSSPPQGAPRVSASSSGIQPSPVDSGGVNPAACWDGSTAPQPVSCADAHRFQAFGSAQECGDSRVREFLGADSLDVIRFGTRTDLDSHSCVVDGLEERAGDFAGALLRDGGAGWRQCVAGVLDVAQTHRVVSCAMPHQAEFLSTGESDAPDLATCAEFAGKYMDRTLASLSRELTVRRIPGASGGEGRPQCAIWIVSGRPLDDTLRNLRNQNLPRE